MKKMNLFLLTVLGAALLLSGCGSKAEEEETTTLELKSREDRAASENQAAIISSCSPRK